MACCTNNGNSIFGTTTSTSMSLIKLKKVRLATTANIAGTYNANTLTTSSPLTVDGITVELGDKILVKSQINTLENGIYTVSSVSPDVILTRSPCFQPACGNTKIYVSEGTTLECSLWFNPHQKGFIFGTSNVVICGDGGSGGGGGTGDITDALNVGGEAEVFKQKNGSILEFRTIEAGNGITITQNADTITITSDNITPGTDNKVVFDINNMEINVTNNTTYKTVGYMAWDQSEYAAFTDGRMTFHVEIGNQEIEYEVIDVDNGNTVLASGTTSGTGSYTVPILLPTADTHIAVNVKIDGTGTDVGKIFGIDLCFK